MTGYGYAVHSRTDVLCITDRCPRKNLLSHETWAVSQIARARPPSPPRHDTENMKIKSTCYTAHFRVPPLATKNSLWMLRLAWLGIDPAALRNLVDGLINEPAAEHNPQELSPQLFYPILCDVTHP